MTTVHLQRTNLTLGARGGDFQVRYHYKWQVWMSSYRTRGVGKAGYRAQPEQENNSNILRAKWHVSHWNEEQAHIACRNDLFGNLQLQTLAGGICKKWLRQNILQNVAFGPRGSMHKSAKIKNSGWNTHNSSIPRPK
jgi:hypothetical protein